MLRPTHNDVCWVYPVCLVHVVISLLFGQLAGCDRTQTLSLTMEDFRFIPNVVEATTVKPIAVSLYNAGREVHEFDSPLLLYSGTPSTSQAKRKADGSPGILLQPGESLRFVVAPPAGTYLYICRRKGHANMTGTLIVE